MKKIIRISPSLFIGAVLSVALQSSVWAQTTLNYTNTADAWLTPASWSPANNWNSGTVKTNTTTANVRLNIGTNVTQAVAVTYNATMGTTILDNTNVATRGFVIGSGSGTTGAVNIVGGTLVVRNGTTADSFLVGSPAASGAGQGTLTLSGGNLIYTNANGSGFGVLCVPYRGGSTIGGANFAQGTFTINSGSTATIERTFFGFTASEANAQCTGIINLNSGGTLNTRNISARDSDASQMASFLNLNGGTLRVLGPNLAAPTVAFITDAGTNLTVNVQSGGAIIDTAGFNATISRGLLDAGGGGGLTKNGAGALTLNQVNTYTGPTAVNGGSMAYVLPMSSSALRLANGTINSITVGNNSWTNSVTSVTNATLNLALGAVTAVPSPTTAVIKTSALNASGTNLINITSAAGISPGVVKLIDYTSSGNRSGGGIFVLGTVPPGLQATLVDGPNSVNLNVVISVQNLTWTATTTSEWATNGALNWDGGANAYQEYPNGINDVANFTDAAGSFYSVNLTNVVKPSLVIFNNTNAAVTLSGVGQIAGTNGITKTGSGTVVMSGSNSFSGAASVDNGILQIDNGGALGSTNGSTVVTGTGTVTIGDGFGAGTTVTGETIILNGAGFGGALGQLRGSIDSGSANTWAGPIVLAANNGRVGTDINGNLTIAGPVSDNGSNYVVLYRPGNGGTITAAYANNSCGGTATFCGSSAVVKLGVNNGFSTNQLLLGTGTVDLNGFSQTVGGLGVFSGDGVLLNNGASASTLTINTAGTNTFVATSLIQNGSQPIGLVKEGTGRQSLSSTNAHTYTGNTVINAGELRLNTTLGSTAVSVNSGGSLTVGTSATVAGSITVNSGGTLSPGIFFVLGVLTNSSTVTLNSGSTTLFHIDATNSSCDRIVANAIAYAGTLVITNQGSTPFTNGQVFQLVNATSPSGNFANAASVTILPGGTGSFNPATGQLTITSLPVAPTLNVVSSGGNLQFSWSGNYRLQSQTNNLGSGLGTNWSDYFTGSTNPVTVPLNSANPAVFFRLISP
jgi:autotransporter-associated beta strand protein